MAAAAQAASAAGSAGATALGLGMGKTDLDLTRDLFKLQMQQAKRLWAADWAENSLRHGEQCLQSAQQHAEAQALGTAAYFQAEKLARQGIKLQRDQDARAYEMAWRAEIRESLRDDLTNQYNRFNIVMLCDTVCLSCVFTLVADATLPAETSTVMIILYLLSMGISITLFSVSLWCAVMVVRRLHEHTAASLERKLFAQSDDLQRAWHQQLESGLPTGPHEIYLVDQAYEKWLAQHLSPIGEPSIHMMAVGVVSMFITAGILMHNRYLLEYDFELVIPIFWSFVLITSTTVLYMKFAEDRKEKKKQGVYDNSWQDQSMIETGPFAKISRAAEELFSDEAVELGSADRVASVLLHERREREKCTQTKALHQRVDSFRSESERRARTRRDVLQLLTTAAEELDALPEELTSRLNKLMHDIDEADNRTADLLTEPTEADNPLDLVGSSRATWNRLGTLTPTAPSRAPMATHPIDAQRIPVSLAAVRKKLGEASLSTLLRIKNLSDEPLRLRSGVQLKQGRYIKSLNAIDPNRMSVCHHLYPGTEIPPRSEVVLAARNNGGKWLPTSGIAGEIVYTNRDETWVFRIAFSNGLVRNVRKCQVGATHVARDDGEDANDGDEEEDNDETDDDQFWTITKHELDIKANNEIAITIDGRRGEDAKKAALVHRKSQLTLKSGFLLKNKSFGLGLQWQQRWVVLNAKEIVYSDRASSKKQSKIALKDITRVGPGIELVKQNVFEIYTRTEGRGPHRFSAASPGDRDQWIRTIRDATGIGAFTDMDSVSRSGDDSSVTTQSVFENGFECVQNDAGTSVLPV